jgi:ribosomal protein S18 acetylase RimI-like enzyme
MTIHLSSNVEDLRIDDVQQMLSKVFWSPGITVNEIRKGILHSALVVGAFNERGEQVGFARAVSDKVRFAYLLDVVVREDCRRQGIGQKMVRFALSHPDMKDVYQWHLLTVDAHGVYEKCGFGSLPNPERWMSIVKARPDRSSFPD